MHRLDNEMCLILLLTLALVLAAAGFYSPRKR